MRIAWLPRHPLHGYATRNDGDGSDLALRTRRLFPFVDGAAAFRVDAECACAVVTSAAAFYRECGNRRPLRRTLQRSMIDFAVAVDLTSGVGPH